MIAAEQQVAEDMRRRQRVSVVAAIVLLLAGGAYAMWGIGRFDPEADPRVDPGFDKPVAEMAFLFDRKDRALDNLKARTGNEQFLIDELRYQMHLTSSLMVLLLRLFLGTFVLMAGLILLTVVVERQRLITAVRQAREAG